jgi:RNA polymerase sigma-70 factor (ECF subfamily)
MGISQLNDAELIRRIHQGEAEAYTPLVERYRNLVYGLAYHQLQNFEDARDVTQEVFVRAYLHLDQLREPHKLTSWLRQMTINQCRMSRRRQHPAVDLLEPIGSGCGG